MQISSIFFITDIKRCHKTKLYRGADSSVHIATGYELEGHGSNSGSGKGLYLLHSVQNGFGPHKTSYITGTGGQQRLQNRVLSTSVISRGVHRSEISTRLSKFRTCMIA
jgi:hypothetical protein